MRLVSLLFSIKLLLGFILTTFLFACVEGDPESDKETSIEVVKDEKNNQLFEVSGKVFSVPSPIQTAFLFSKCFISIDQAIG